jgi:SLOG cluster3 family
MINIFLSASVPLPERNRKFFETADILAIRESIKSLVEIVLPVGRLTCGGHPAITPLLALFSRDLGLGNDRISIYQSALFAAEFPPEIDQFIDVRVVDSVDNDREKSLTKMRLEMVSSRRFDAAVFIGGMEGLFEEKNLFVQFNPRAKLLPLATTGAAAAIIHSEGNFPALLAQDRTYSSLFRRQLKSVD